MAADIRQTFLQPAVQEVMPAGRTKGGIRRPLATRRLEHAFRCMEQMLQS